MSERSKARIRAQYLASMGSKRERESKGREVREKLRYVPPKTSVHIVMEYIKGTEDVKGRKGNK